MRQVLTILSGIGLLIMLYLFLSRGQETVAIINAIAQNTVSGIRVLQGRG